MRHGFETAGDHPPLRLLIDNQPRRKSLGIIRQGLAATGFEGSFCHPKHDA